MTPKIKTYHHTNYWSDLYNIILYLDLRDSRVSLVRACRKARDRDPQVQSPPTPRRHRAVIVVGLLLLLLRYGAT